MAEQTEVEWPTCEQAGCIGIRLAAARACLAHASVKDTAAALKLVSETGAIDARGVPIKPALLESILAAAPRGENGEPLIEGCRFDQAIFSGDAQFAGATFSGNAEFNHASFRREAGFNQATFSGDAQFAGATFSGNAEFNHASFRREAGVTSNGETVFSEAIFCGEAGFNRAHFSGFLLFSGATFGGPVVFSGAILAGPSGSRGDLGGPVWFGQTLFGGAPCHQAPSDMPGAARLPGSCLDEATSTGADGAVMRPQRR